RAQYGNTDIDAAINRYMPFIDQYAAAGHRIMLAFTHQTYGEGRDEFYPWSSQTSDKWRQLTTRYSEFIHRAAERFKGKVQAYQIWNEQDTGWNRPDIRAQDIVAAVPLKPEDYAIVLAGGIQAVRSADSTAAVITGGHVGGPGRGPQYARITLQNLPSGLRPDGIACHPYGRGAQGSKRDFMHFGLIDEEIDGYMGIAPDIPVWITEWGVLGPGHEPPPASPEDIADYAARFVQVLKTKYGGKVAAAIWFAWADTMHNGYGLIDRGGKDKSAFLGRFQQL
ncbi:MAG: hypothetical protein H7175_02755, partial [Burkholderiales bacterium]|nr:hypothetical protein [Anaerolineae bacterium]